MRKICLYPTTNLNNHAIYLTSIIKELTICAFCLKALLQTWQTKGFSPVWILRCCLKLNRLELINSPQTGQHLSSDLNNSNVKLLQNFHLNIAELERSITFFS